MIRQRTGEVRQRCEPRPDLDGEGHGDLSPHRIDQGDIASFDICGAEPWVDNDVVEVQFDGVRTGVREQFRVLNPAQGWRR